VIDAEKANYKIAWMCRLLGVPRAGVSTGDAMAIMTSMLEQKKTEGIGHEWTALSFQEQRVGGEARSVFILALVVVYLILAGLYESWTLPLPVILSIPLAVLGAMLGLLWRGMDNNIYTQVGLVLLVGLGAKNAILIVEVARDARNVEGKEIVDAAVLAARTRFRPILMTSFAFILGVVPLVTATGAGANSRISLGLAVMSGMLASTCLAVLFVPSFFTMLQRYEEWRKKGKAKKTVATSAP